MWTTGNGRRVCATAVAGGAMLLLGALAPAAADAKTQPNPEFERFAHCPVTVKKVTECLVAVTSNGEFKLANKTVKITKPITLQGGIEEDSRALVPASDGGTLSRAQLPVPGGLLGIEGLESVGGEVLAVTELAGPVQVFPANLEGAGTAVEMPLKVKLENALLGESCYVGSESEPIVLRLTTGTTSPPAPNEPIEGDPGSASFNAALTIITISGVSLVDNSFSAPGANGCGGALSLLLDEAVNLQVGLPSASGNNTAILDGSLAEAAPVSVKKAKVIPKS